MPVGKCTEGGKPGYRWGESGKCFTYTPDNKQSQAAAKMKAIKQGLAVAYRTGTKPEL